MRTLVLCLAGAAAGIMAFNVVVPAAGTALRATAPEGPVNRAAKSGREAAPAAAGPRSIVAAVEVVGIEAAAVIYRDRDGRVLFRTDPLRNTTVVVRGTELPQVTVRTWAADAVNPTGIGAGEPAASPDKPSVRDEKLPQGCEPAASLLSPSGSSALRARCMAGLVPTRVASIAR